MSGSFDGSTVRHTRVGPSGTISYPFAGGWTIFFMFQPGASQTNNPAYIYSHNQVFQPADSINIWQNSSGNKIVARVETAASTPLDDKVTSNTVVSSTWNAFALTWDGVNFNMFLNGTQTVHAPAAGTATYTPPDQVTIGMHGDLSTGQYEGDVCHVSKLSRPLTSDEGQKYTSILVSPRFAQESLNWHCPMWNADFNFDEQQVQTVTDTNMVYASQAPAAHPCMAATNIDDINLLPVLGRRAYSFIG